MTNSMPGEPGALLLDTRALLYLLNGDEEIVGPRARLVAEEAQGSGGLRICDASLFELAELERLGRLVFAIPLLAWLEQALSTPGLSLERLTPEIAAEAARLPAALRQAAAPASAPDDSATAPGELSLIDRIIAATARVRGLRLLAGGDALVSYGNAGYLSIVSLR